MDYRKFDDEALLRLITQGNQNAISELYDRYSRLVYSIALNATSNPSLAEDITQDVFIRIWEKADSYRSEQAKVSTWMTSITRYRTIDLIRRQKSRPEGNLEPWATVEELNPSDPVNTETQVDLSLRRQRVRDALAKIPNSQREALAYAYFGGYSHAEIAELLGEPLGTVKTRIRLAMQKLRDILADESLIK